MPKVAGWRANQSTAITSAIELAATAAAAAARSPPPSLRPRLQAFTLRRNTQLLRNDYSWHLFFLAFGLAGLAKWFTRGTLPPLSEVASICLYTGWSPAILYLIKRRCAACRRLSCLTALPD